MAVSFAARPQLGTWKKPKYYSGRVVLLWSAPILLAAVLVPLFLHRGPHEPRPREFSNLVELSDSYRSGSVFFGTLTAAWDAMAEGERLTRALELSVRLRREGYTGFVLFDEKGFPAAKWSGDDVRLVPPSEQT